MMRSALLLCSRSAPRGPKLPLWLLNNEVLVVLLLSYSISINSIIISSMIMCITILSIMSYISLIQTLAAPTCGEREERPSRRLTILTQLYIYIYIEREREKERCIHMFTQADYPHASMFFFIEQDRAIS